MKIKDVMTTEVVTIQGVASVFDALTLMQENGLRSLIVERREAGDPYGIITKTDIMKKVVALEKDPHEVQVHEVMSKPCIVVNKDWDVKYAARLMSKARIHCAPVIEEGLNMCGVISVSDTLKAVQAVK